MAKYDLYKVHGIDNQEQEEKYRARLVTEGSISKERLFKRVEQISGFNHGQADAIMSCIADAAVEFLREGYIVQLGDLGYLSATVTSHSVQKKKEIHAGSVRFNNVNLRISASLRKRMRSMPLERVEKPVTVSKDTSLEQRKELLKEHLRTFPCITRTDYAQLAHILKSKAVCDLKIFVEEGWLVKYGAGPAIVYLLAKS